MAMIPAESLPYFEQMIYLPMVIIVLERNRDAFENGEFKLKKPYVDISDKAIKLVQADLKVAKQYMRDNNLKLLKGEVDKTTTTYTFFHGGYEQDRRYLNVRLRNRTEELLEMYLMKIN
ncbi:MAG: hypothetical protein R3328_00090 [Planococcaceae bacterium]|nr:hypothetical protein [Planococcaceae bacterium]